VNNLLLIAIALAGLMPAHDFYISILTMEHDAGRKELKLTWRMTTHDIEHALAPEVQGRRLHLGGEQELPQAGELLRAYVLQHIDLRIDGAPVEVKYLGREVEMEDMYCYLLVEDVGRFDSITVISTLLFDMFDEQENVVHLKVAGGTLTHAFRNNSPPHTFTPQR
jgi:hypothetical protein